MFCTNCGAKILEGKKFCGQCGTRVGSAEPRPDIQSQAPQQPVNQGVYGLDGQSQMMEQPSTKMEYPQFSGGEPVVRGKIAKLIIGIISLVLCVIITFQSCAAGIYNTFSDRGEVSGSGGLCLAICMLVAGIVGIVTRKTKNGAVASGTIYIIGALVGLMLSGTFTDLIVWSVLVLLFGITFIVFSATSKDHPPKPLYKQSWFWVTIILAPLSIFICVPVLFLDMDAEMTSGERSRIESNEEANNQQVPELGSRLNPVPLGDAFIAEYLRYAFNDETIGYTIQILETMRGKEAADYAVSLNQFNEIPADKELLLAKVKFTLTKYTIEDSFLCSDIHIDYFDGSYSEITNRTSVAGLDDLHANLYEGGSTEGWIHLDVNPDEERPMICFDERTWLLLQ